MRLLADDGTSLELNVVGYQFPQLVGVPYDSNWLIIAGHVALGGREWKFRDPCLLTNEVLALAEWFEARSKASNDDEFGFIEPNLSFKWRQGVLQVHLDLESRPSWASEDNTEEFYLRFSPSLDELTSAASSLRADLIKYPIRPE